MDEVGIICEKVLSKIVYYLYKLPCYFMLLIPD